MYQFNMSAKSILSNYLNDDVTRIIDDYLYQLCHREQLKKMANTLIRESYLRLYYRCPPFDMYELIGMDECINMFKAFENCNCCEEHNKRKPTIYHFYAGYVPPYSTSNRKKICPCPCRHICRMICREVNDEILEDDFTEQDDMSIS